MTPRPFSMIRPSPERVAEFDNHQPSSSPQFDYRSPQALKRQHVEAQQQRARKKDRISGGVSGYAVESDSPRGMEKRNSVSLGEESSNGPNLDIRVPPLSAPVAEQPNTALLRPGADSNQHEVSSGDPSDDATQAKPAAMPVSSAPSVSQIQGGQRPGVTFGPQNQGFQIGINYGVIYNGTSAAELARPKPSSHRDATTSSQLSETEKACLQSFWFPGMYVRQRSLEPSAEHTCKWLSERLAYQDWLEDRNQDKYCGLLWLKGNPGTGKSTLMIESYVEAFRNESKSNFITAAFFFNAKGQQLNHSPEGMYRSLLHQLLPKHRDCLQHLSEKGGFEDTPSPETRDWGNTYWKESELRSLFRSMLLTHSTTKRSIIFVDALDECDKDHVRQQVYFWRDLTKAARTAGISLSVCISSRHFPSITVSDCPEIVVEHFNQCDIAIYTEQRLQLAIAAHEPRWQQLRDSIVECSNGVFLWVALVIDQVLKSWDEGNDFGSLLKELKKVPRDLDMLYRTMFEAISPADMPLTRQLFEWSILAVKPLRLHEWHHIMAFIQCPSLSSLAEWKASESYIDSDEQLERRIKSLSKGLIEVRKPRTEEALDMNVDLISTCAGAGSLDTEQGNTRIVQVIHESVREYFMNDRNLFHRSGELHPVAMGHVSIMNTCLGYLGITELDGLVEARIQAQRRAETGFEHQDKEQAELQSRDQGMINGISREGLPQDMEVDVDSSPPRDSMEACSLDICPNLRIIRWMETSHSGYDRMCADPGRASPPSQPHSPNTAAMSEVLESYPALLSYAVFELFTHAQLAQKWEADVSTVLLHFSVERNWARWCALREADLPVFDLSSLIVYANTIGLHTWVERLKHPESPKIPTLAPMREDWGAQLKIPKPFDFGPSDFGPAVGGFRDPKSTLPSPYIDEAIPSTAPPRLSRRGSVASFSSAGSHTGSAVAADNGNGGTPRQSPTPRTKGSPSSSWDLGALQKPRGAKEKPAWFFLCECCPKKPKKFDTAEELRAHEAEKQYECSYCGNRFKNKNEAERHQNSFHARRYSWSCSAISGYDAAFHNSTTHPDEADTCGYCGEEFARSRHGHGLGTGTPSRGIASRYATEQDWKKRIHHLQESHKFKECNLNKKFFRADHFRQHLKHSHAGTSGKWTNMLENACMADENPT